MDSERDLKSGDSHQLAASSSSLLFDAVLTFAGSASGVILGFEV